ncbi:MAG: hypothetical protein KDK07_17825 [Bauldia sp.]|nr:hypothetical protein [Bauldia sp.]
MHADVGTAIADLYRIFSPYRFGAGARDSGAPVMLGPLEERLLRTLPIRELPADLLVAYARALPYELCAPVSSDLRALLPRYLELFAAGAPDLDPGLMHAFEGLARAGYRDHWSGDEVAALDRFMEALERAAAGDDDRMSRAARLAAAAGRAKIDGAPGP